MPPGVATAVFGRLQVTMVPRFGGGRQGLTADPAGPAWKLSAGFAFSPRHFSHPSVHADLAATRAVWFPCPICALVPRSTDPPSRLPAPPVHRCPKGLLGSLPGDWIGFVPIRSFLNRLSPPVLDTEQI